MMASTKSNGPTAPSEQSTIPPGSPSATTTIDGKHLPRPPSKFGGVINLSAEESKRFWIAGYMDKSEVFDKAMAPFGKTYANQTERDHAAFKNAIRQGRIEVQAELRLGVPTGTRREKC